MKPHLHKPEIARCFGANVREARLQADLSQEELADLADLHRTEIGMIERGVRIARIDTLIKLAGSLELPPGDLLSDMLWTPAYRPAGHFSHGRKP